MRLRRALLTAALATAARGLVTAGLVTACGPSPTANTPEGATLGTATLATSGSPASKAAPLRFDAIPRLEFNQIAAELALPLFWIADENSSGSIDPGELAVLWGISKSSSAWIVDGKFTPAFDAAYASVAKVKTEGHPTAGLDESEKHRRATVRPQLAQGRQTLVRSDFRSASAEDRAFVGHMLAAAEIIDRLYQRQLGTLGLDKDIPADDAASRMLFYRNQSPQCMAPMTEKDPACRGLPKALTIQKGLYPESLTRDPKFCEKLEARPDQQALLSPFSVVKEEGGGLKAVPYTVAYKDDMAAVSRELSAGAAALKNADEAPLKAYLNAAAKSFLDNAWEPADEAWAKMGVDNSKWYLRIGPDEVHSDPCNRKGGFHMSFARINQASVAWQKKLEPVKNDMEAKLAKLAGAPYKARKVSFHLPDFIDIILNAGDSRDPFGATGGQSLPNWGPVANEGRGRTVAMVNLYTDPDSLKSQRVRVESLLCKGSFDAASLDRELSTMSTVLHEAAHNLGPSAEYKVKGKTDSEAFGGALATIFEELKAQTGSLYLSHWLAGKGLIEKKTANLANLSDIYWAFGQIAQGLYNAEGKPKAYPQLASIQIGSLLEAGAMSWKPDESAVNGSDKGCFEIHKEKMPSAIAALEKTTLGIKGRADEEAASKLREVFVDKDGDWRRLRGVIDERWRREPRSSFVYSVER